MQQSHIVFFEPDAFDRQSHRDIEPPAWARVVVWPATPEGMASAAEQAGAADVVVKASGVGVYDDALLDAVLAAAGRDAVRIFWDVDAPATLAALRSGAEAALRAQLPTLDLVLTYGGGPPVIAAYRELGAAQCVAVYNGLDPALHHPVLAEPRYAVDLAFLGNRLPDREARVAEFLFRPAAILAERRFLIGGSGWADKPTPGNIALLGHVPTASHNAFNCSPIAVLNIARDSMASTGFSPATRVFEAAGAAACVITDAWEGIELFLEPGAEILVARDGADVAAQLRELTPARAKSIGEAARRRCIADHTYKHRAKQVHDLLTTALGRRRARAA